MKEINIIRGSRRTGLVWQRREIERRQIQDVCWNKSLREADELEVQPKEKTNRKKSESL